MSATLINESVVVASHEPLASSSTAAESAVEGIESATCECCGLTEDCTPEYIERIRERYGGKWICGLCAEAAKDEICRSDRLISTEEALARHLNVCRMFRCSWPPETDPAVHLITAFRQILRRGLECPRGVRSTPASPMRAGSKGTPLARSESV